MTIASLLFFSAIGRCLTIVTILALQFFHLQIDRYIQPKLCSDRELLVVVACHPVLRDARLFCSLGK